MTMNPKKLKAMQQKMAQQQKKDEDPEEVEEKTSKYIG